MRFITFPDSTELDLKRVTHIGPEIGDRTCRRYKVYLDSTGNIEVMMHQDKRYNSRYMIRDEFIMLWKDAIVEDNHDK